MPRGSSPCVPGLSRGRNTLIARLLKWQAQPVRRSRSWRSTIAEQRKRIALALDETPSLKNSLSDLKWQEAVWSDARVLAMTETGLAGENFPEAWPWAAEVALTADWMPEERI